MSSMFALVGYTSIEITSHAEPFSEIICGESLDLHSCTVHWYIISYDSETGEYLPVWISSLDDMDTIVQLLNESLYAFGPDHFSPPFRSEATVSLLLLVRVAQNLPSAAAMLTAAAEQLFQGCAGGEGVPAGLVNRCLVMKG